MMALTGRLLCRRSARYTPLVTVPCLTVLSRNYASQDDRASNQHADEVFQDSPLLWPDSRLGPLQPQDRRFPLPGLVGSRSLLQRSTMTMTTRPRYDADLLTAEMPHERQSTVLEQFLTVSNELAAAEDTDALQGFQSLPFDLLECTAQQCPYFLLRDFQLLFPDKPLHSTKLTLITVSQRSEVTGWSTDVDEEKDELLQRFVDASVQICEALHNAGFWADFIDPSSGRPYLGANVNAELLKADERYRRFGFEIQRIGSCTVVRHHTWGTTSYVGSVFTNAPVKHAIIEEFVKKSTSNRTK